LLTTHGALQALQICFDSLTEILHTSDRLVFCFVLCTYVLSTVFFYFSHSLYLVSGRFTVLFYY